MQSNSPWNNVLSRWQRIQLQTLHKTPANFNLLPPHSSLRMLYLFNTSPKLSNIPGHQVNTSQHLTIVPQLRISCSDIIIWINWVLLDTTSQLSYISNPALNELENCSIHATCFLSQFDVLRALDLVLCFWTE